MKLAILETGVAPGDLPDTFGRYDDMFRRMLGQGFDYQTFRVFEGDFPTDPAAFGGVLLTGSPAGVYDGLPWIADLEALLRQAAGQTRIAGICFGHQVMASAFGGEVIQSPKGWGLGLHTYEIQQRTPWMDDAAAISVPVSHQDQVVRRPDSARVVAASEFTPNGALEYTEFPAISFQCHPEFDPAFARALIERRRHRLDPALAEPALASLERPNDNARVAGWIANFLRS